MKYLKDYEIQDIANPLNTKEFEPNEGSFNGRIRYGDLNIDGYPEIYLSLVVKEKTSGKLEYKSMVLMNN